MGDVRRREDEETKFTVSLQGSSVCIAVNHCSYSDVVAQVLDVMPPDSKDAEESLYVALFSGNMKEILQCAHKLDPWLSAHLADLMVPLQLIDNEVNE